MLKVLEKKRDVKFNLDYQLLGGVSSLSSYLQAPSFPLLLLFPFDSFTSPPNSSLSFKVRVG